MFDCPSADTSTTPYQYFKQLPVLTRAHTYTVYQQITCGIGARLKKKNGKKEAPVWELRGREQERRSSPRTPFFLSSCKDSTHQFHRLRLEKYTIYSHVGGH